MASRSTEDQEDRSSRAEYGVQDLTVLTLRVLVPLFIYLFILSKDFWMDELYAGPIDYMPYLWLACIKCALGVYSPI